MIKPEIKAIILCDTVITDLVTKKNSVIGIFENILSPTFPCTHPRIYVYVNFTKAQGKYKPGFELVCLEDNASIVPRQKMPNEIESIDEKGSHNIIFVLEGVRFEKPGMYEFRLFLNDELCATRPLQVKKP